MQPLGCEIVLPCDVEDIASVDQVFKALRAKWDRLDFLVHAIGFTDKNELRGRYADTTRENFSRTMLISCFSFTEIAKRAAELMPAAGGSMITLTFGASMRAMPNYNVMGVAKAALEASVRYLASDFGPQGIRVNAISAGPVRAAELAGQLDDDSIRLAAAGVRRLYREWAALPAGETLRLTWPLHDSWLRLMSPA